ncbi:MAG: hypothetical protein V7640_808, partial [Betaproteobacteria bacterium]
MEKYGATDRALMSIPRLAQKARRCESV